VTTPWWIPLSDELMQAVLLDRVPAAETDATAAFLVELFGLAPGARVYEQCAGTGRVALALAARGYVVVGSELAASYVEVARTRAQAARLDARFDVADAFAYVAAPAVDGVFNWWTGFGYGATDAENRRMIAAAFASLRPGGRYAVDVPNLIALARGFRPVMVDRVSVDGGELLLLRESALALDRGTLDKRWTYVLPDGSRRVHETSTRLYLPHQLRALFEAEGFVDVLVRGGPGEPTLGLDAPRCVVVGRRPA
jgi:SAM-dependent methyltransferase